MVRYATNLRPGVYLRRINRFVAEVEVDGGVHQCHKMNPGRMFELLVPGARVWVEETDNPTRKTRFSLKLVEAGGQVVGIDSVKSNAFVHELLEQGLFPEVGEISTIIPEFTRGRSKFDFYVRRRPGTFPDSVSGHVFIEVKTTNCVIDGIGLFPDAPTTRGTKHVRELIEAVGHQHEAYIIQVIQRLDAQVWRPYATLDPPFAASIAEAATAGVHIIACQAKFEGTEMLYAGRVPVEAGGLL
jgi:sugar fermentation stimulation protein A